MNFSALLVESLSEKHLLKHAWYQEWNDGAVSMESLRLYAKQYYHHVKAFPRYLSATHSQCIDISARQVLLDNLKDEESGDENHPELWLRFAEGLGVNRSEMENSQPLPEVQALIDSFFSSSRSSYAEGLGALFAYEHQVPEIATFKIEALRKHYAIREERSLSFFETHRQADVYHTQAVCKLLDELSKADQDKAMQAAKVASDQLWKFLDGIQNRAS